MRAAELLRVDEPPVSGTYGLRWQVAPRRFPAVGLYEGEIAKPTDHATSRDPARARRESRCLSIRCKKFVKRMATATRHPASGREQGWISSDIGRCWRGRISVDHFKAGLRVGP